MRAELTYPRISEVVRCRAEPKSSTAQWIRCAKLYTLLSLLILPAGGCFTCEGPCMDSVNCNCQINHCEGEYCYSEIFPNREFGVGGIMKYYVRKGCLKRPLQDEGCDYVQHRTHKFCVCRGRFCNQVVSDPPLNQTRSSPQVRCYQSEPSCDRLCEGNYCIKDISTGAESCGDSTPFLKFSRQSWDLLDNGLSSGEPTCSHTVTGTSIEGQCICDKNGCNKSPQTLAQVNQIISLLSEKSEKEVDIFQSQDYSLPAPQLYQCFSCDKSGDNVMPTHCQDFSCYGQFCVLVLETQITKSPNIHRKAGCLNTTRPRSVPLGCSQKWRGREHEVIECVCAGDFCNIDLHTAYASTALRLPFTLALFRFIVFLVIAQYTFPLN